MWDRLISSGFQNEVSLTQYASFSTRSLKPNASNISIVRQAIPSAWPSSSGPDFCSTIRVLMSENAASCAASVSPAGPQPTIRTSTSSGRASGGSVPCSAASDSSGLPGLNPLRWNCMVSLASPDAIVRLLHGCELAFIAKPHFGVSRRDQGATRNQLSPQDDGGNLSVCR